MNRLRILIAAYATALVTARVAYSSPASAEYAARESRVFLVRATDPVRWHNRRRLTIDAAGVVAGSLLLARAGRPPA